MRTMDEIRKELGEVRAACSELRGKDAPEGQWRPLATEVGALMKELSSAISEGAEACEHCNTLPHGLRHVYCQVRNGQQMNSYVFEVGCLVCKDHRAVGPTREDAVIAWNASQYLPPKEQPAAK